jgi:hypothetical protein
MMGREVRWMEKVGQERGANARDIGTKLTLNIRFARMI